MHFLIFHGLHHPASKCHGTHGVVLQDSVLSLSCLIHVAVAVAKPWTAAGRLRRIEPHMYRTSTAQTAMQRWDTVTSPTSTTWLPGKDAGGVGGCWGSQGTFVLHILCVFRDFVLLIVVTANQQQRKRLPVNDLFSPRSKL